MYSLLFEEIQEIKSIYRSIENQIDYVKRDEFFAGVAGVIKSIVDTIKSTLEWIEYEVIKTLDVYLETKREFKIFYDEILRCIYDLKNRAIVLNQLITIITFNFYIMKDEKYRLSLIALNKFINNAKILLTATPNLNFCVLIEHEYAAIDILKNENTIIFCIPIYDIFRPWKWSLLFHEMGHAFFREKKKFFIQIFRERIRQLLQETAPESIIEEIREIVNNWEQYWLEEFIADLYGVYLGGPSFTYAFLIEVFSGDWQGYFETHPSFDSRIYLQLRFIENNVDMKDLSVKIQSLFPYGANALSKRLGYPFPAKVLNELYKCFMDVVKMSPLTAYATIIIELEKKISNNEVIRAEPLHIILALALSNENKNDAIQEKIIKIIAEDQ